MKTKYILDHENYGQRAEFDSLEELQECVRACGGDFANSTFCLSGTGRILDETGATVGEVFEDANANANETAQS